MRRIAFFSMFKALIVSVAVFGFAACSHALTINATLQAGELNWELRINPNLEFINGSYFGQDHSLDWTCDPGLVNIRQTSTDAAATTGVFKDENGDCAMDLLTVSVDNAYQGYYNSISMQVYNGGNEPIVVPQPVLKWLGQDIPAPEGTAITLYDHEGYPVIDFCWNNNTGKTLLPGRKLEEVFEFLILAKPEPPVGEVKGLTPGFWKNWSNHFTEQQFNTLLQNTIAADINKVDLIFKKYNASPGKELTILKAHLLATQLTLNLTKTPELPNPGVAFLNEANHLEWSGGSITVGEAVDRALGVLANPSAYSRANILEIKDLLDMINNL